MKNMKHKRFSSFDTVIIIIIPSLYSTACYSIVSLFLSQLFCIHLWRRRWQKTKEKKFQVFLFAHSIPSADCNIMCCRRYVPFPSSLLSHFTSFSMSGREPRKCFSIFPFYYMPFNEMRKWKMEKRQVKRYPECVHMKEFFLSDYLCKLMAWEVRISTRHTVEVEGINFRLKIKWNGLIPFVCHQRFIGFSSSLFFCAISELFTKDLEYLHAWVELRVKLLGTLQGLSDRLSPGTNCCNRVSFTQ